MANIVMPRLLYTDHSTLGAMIHQARHLCHTLEDVTRPPGAPKVPGRTAIPAGRYRIILSLSRRFGIVLPEILNVPDFTGIRAHSGKTEYDTEGCILCAHNIQANDKIYGPATDLLIAVLQQPGEHWIEIINTFPYTGHL